MNSVQLFGRLVKDIDLKFIAGSGTAIADFTLAVDKGLSRDKKAEFEAQGKPTSNFIRCKCFGKSAETLSQYTAKGSQLVVEGSIDTGSYKNAEGQTVYTTDVLVSRFNFVGAVDKKEKKADDDFSFGSFEESDDDVPFL